MRIDINCDMGESFGLWTMGNDADLMPYISSANIAGGYHAGDAHVMRKTVLSARDHGVAIGIHCGFRDLEGFGRRYIQMTAQEVQDDVLYQLGALQAFAAHAGLKVQHVKPHGALYMMAAQDDALSRALIEILGQVDPEPILFCMEASATYAVARQMGYPVAVEFYADRDYDDTGQIIFTRKVDDVLNPQVVTARVMRALKEGSVITTQGHDIAVKVDTICIHGDTPGAPQLLKNLRQSLVEEGIEVGPIGTTQS